MDDLISRKDAIDAVKKNTFRLTFAEEQNCEGHVAWSANAVYSDVIEGALLELPSADYQKTVQEIFNNVLYAQEQVLKRLPSAQRTGEWIDENNIPVGWHKVDKSSPAGLCKCSNCGEWLVASDECFVKGNFCPNCGADMRGEADDETGGN